jgi:hypothetical protein
MKSSMRHDRNQESIEAKMQWFRSLSIDDRMETFCSFTDLALSVNPNLKDRNHAQQVAGRIQVLSATIGQEDLINTKRASGRKVDLEDVRLLELPDQDQTTS